MFQTLWDDIRGMVKANKVSAGALILVSGGVGAFVAMAMKGFSC